MSINLEFYSDKCIVIRDNHNMHSSEIIRLGGKFNDKLRGGPGWIFSRNMEKKLFDCFGDMLSTNQTPNSTPEFKPISTSTSGEVDDTLKYINDIESMLLDAHKKLSIVKNMMINKKGNKNRSTYEDPGETEEQEEFATKKRLIK